MRLCKKNFRSMDLIFFEESGVYIGERWISGQRRSQEKFFSRRMRVRTILDYSLATPLFIIAELVKLSIDFQFKSSFLGFSEKKHQKTSSKNLWLHPGSSLWKPSWLRTWIKARERGKGVEIKYFCSSIFYASNH